MKQIYKLAQDSFTAGDGPNPRGKVFHMGYIDGYLAGFRAAKAMVIAHLRGRGNQEDLYLLGETETDESKCGAV